MVSVPVPHTQTDKPDAALTTDPNDVNIVNTPTGLLPRSKHDPDGTLPYVAKMVAKHFPELQNRAFPVLDADVTKENVPTLPVAMVMLEREIGNHSSKQRSHATPEEQFIVEFWLPPATKYLDKNQIETPYWTYYDYHSLRNRFLPIIFDMKPPLGGRVEYVGLELEALQFAVVITFKLSHQFEFCEPELEHVGHDGKPMNLSFDLVAPVTDYCGPCIEPEKDED